MELRAQNQYRLVGRRELIMIVVFALCSQFALALPGSQEILEERARISEAERRQRDTLGNLFLINQRIKEIARKKARLNGKLMSKDAEVREAAQDVNVLEERVTRHRDLLSERLRRLYQDRFTPPFQWVFSAAGPADLERHHRFLKLMVDSDHRYVRDYLSQLERLRKKRRELAGKVAQLLSMQKDVQGQERELTQQMREKSRLLAELRQLRDHSLTKLKSLRDTAFGSLGSDYAFFERKGTLHSPVDAPLRHGYGTFVDPQYRFKLMRKGQFYRAERPLPVTAVFPGKVVLAGPLPGYGKAVVVDHGDSYYTVYALASQIKVREGAEVKEGEILALAGHDSPLFGPGLYFEIRHFTDAIDPRDWIKESGMKTAAAKGVP